MLYEWLRDDLLVMICVDEVDVIGQPAHGEDDHHHDEHFHHLKWKLHEILHIPKNCIAVNFQLSSNVFVSFTERQDSWRTLLLAQSASSTILAYFRHLHMLS